MADFPWDKMYFFIDSADQQTVERVLGTKVPTLQDGSKIIFTNNGKVVLFETEPYELEKRLPDDVAFDGFPDTKYYRVYGSAAQFAVKKVDLSDGVAYDLTLVGDAPR